MARAEQVAATVAEQVHRAVVGQDATIEQCLVATLAGGHVLLEGVPGTAKTLLVKLLAAVLGREFKRVQLTPDLMPADILGTYVFETTSSSFALRRGPIFTSVLLADEINRAPAKTQSALLEGMQERQVTIDGITHPLDGAFTVFATQNPVEFEGTYPLPEAQLDRFLMKVLVDYPSQAEEDQLLANVHAGFDAARLDRLDLRPIAAEEVAAAQQEIAQTRVEPNVIRYISSITRATRDHAAVVLGCSPRASVMVFQAARVLAALRGRQFVIPDDIKAMALPVLRHRLVLRPEADIEGLTPDDVLAGLLDALPVPR